jgi:putative endonuclease
LLRDFISNAHQASQFVRLFSFIDLEMFYVYIIYSEKVKKKYIGQTDNLDWRILEHDNGTLGGYTKNKAPWKLIHHELYSTRSEAMVREKYLKTGV